ncbi:hypothetical protein [Amycolatopsis sp. MJM2582]|uniref:5-methylcytosine restriction system specificity protein McrC n=1 Tax=Amycolatopsis sp. MJM2582 TaxID=1427749 RepID=UPI003510A3E9
MRLSPQIPRPSRATPHRRGRIDFAEQLRVSPGRDLPTAVTYQSHDEDILEYQLMRTALDLLAQVPVRAAAKSFRAR